MKKIIFLLLILISFSARDSYSVVVIQRVYFSGNNICNYYQNTGIFNKFSGTANTAGLYWHCDPMQSYCFTAGFNIAANVNGNIAMVMASYGGEYSPGYYMDSMFVTNADFKIYKVSRTDFAWSNPDYANWYKMVPFGAPYDDVNNNCLFDRDIDKPGVREAKQTLFVVLTDGDISQHNPGEGFGGGVTNPLLGAEVRLTVWAYEDYLPDVQYMRYQVVNKSKNAWDSTYFSIFADCDSPIEPLRDLTGCDTNLQIGYNYSNDTVVRGAYGIQMLQGPVNKLTGDTLRLSSFNISDLQYSCNGEANGVPRFAYNYMKGYKTDGTWFLDPTYTPYKKTKFVFSGDPETNSGWTAQKGFIMNCNGQDTGALAFYSGHDTKLLLSTGGDNFKVMPGEVNNLYFAQMIAKGLTNKNSVTKLKSLAYSSRVFFKSGLTGDVENCTGTIIPDDFSISQNFPNPFNSQTVIRYNVPRSAYIKITIYDLLGKEISVPVNNQVNAGFYEINISALNLSSGIYFYRMEVTDNAFNNTIKRGRTYKMAIIK